jgi:hypothetical protein
MEQDETLKITVDLEFENVFQISVYQQMAAQITKERQDKVIN